MSDEEQKPIRIKMGSFQVDNNLMFLIQSITKKPTQDILGYFYSTATTLTEEGLKHCVAQQFKRRLDYFYPGTDIPYRLEVWSGWQTLRGYNADRSKPLDVSVSISFPKKPLMSDVADMITNFTEVGLGLTEGEDLPLFQKPATRVPRGMKKKL